MIKTEKKRILHVLLVGVLLLVAGLVVIEATAAGSGDEYEFAWLVRDGATCAAQGLICENDPIFKICREECLVNVSTGEEIPSGNVGCFSF